jgi:hypothetical protein
MTQDMIALIMLRRLTTLGMQPCISGCSLGIFQTANYPGFSNASCVSGSSYKQQQQSAGGPAP